jgi:DNA-binding MarR family transcriptional regulator
MSAETRDAALARDRADVLVDLLISGSGSGLGTDCAEMRKLGIRLRRLASHLEREIRRELAAHGIEVWELEVLLALRRAPDFTLSAGALLRGSQVTAGAISNRLARLEASGLIRRDADPADRRQTLVTLTPDGVRRADCITEVHLTAEERLLGRADPDTIHRLSADLRTLLLTIEGPATDQHPYERC